MEYKVGDVVRFRDSVGIAVVSRIVGNIIYIKDDSGFEHEYQRHELLPFQTMEIADVSIKDEKKITRKVPEERVKKLTIDLHSHVLFENIHGMTRYEILNYQMDKVVQTINEAKNRKINKVLIIHGIGSGRLKDEVHLLLSKMDKLNYYLADFTDGGYGATVVEILLSKH